MRLIWKCYITYWPYATRQTFLSWPFLHQGKAVNMERFLKLYRLHAYMNWEMDKGSICKGRTTCRDCSSDELSWHTIYVVEYTRSRCFIMLNLKPLTDVPVHALLSYRMLDHTNREHLYSKTSPSWLAMGLVKVVNLGSWLTDAALIC